MFQSQSVEVHKEIGISPTLKCAKRLDLSAITGGDMMELQQPKRLSRVNSEEH